MKTGKHTSWNDFVTPDYWISHRFDLAVQQYQVEAYVKVCAPRGVKLLLWWGQEYDEEHVLREAMAQGTFSSRPYRLGQGADSTTAACVDALYRHFCAARKLDPEALYFKAYQKRIEPGYDMLQTRHLAEWQGLVYPNQWSDTAVFKLLHDLGAINNHGLVASILEVIPQLEHRFYHVPRRRATQSAENS
jgi:hypothetical protein